MNRMMATKAATNFVLFLFFGDSLLEMFRLIRQENVFFLRDSKHEFELQAFIISENKY